MSHDSNLVFAQLTKIDEEKRLVYGRATQEVPDRVGEIFDYASSKPMFEEWSKSQSEASMGKSSGNIRAMHKDVAAGIIVPGGLTFHDDELAIDVCAKIIDDNEWDKCLSGVYTGFSIGGSYGKKWEDDEMKKTRFTAKPSEISLVDRPCVPTATFFEIQKADGSVMQKNFVEKAAAEDGEYKESAKETISNETPQDEMKPEDEDSETIKNRKKLQEAANPPTEETAKAEPDQIEVNGSDADVLEFAKVLNDQNLTMRDAITALTKIAEREDVNPEAGKKEYGNVKFADEKNKKYPIDNEEHIRAAWNYINKEKNAGKYSPDDVKSIKAKIVSAWKSKIDKEGPPSVAEKAETSGDLRKGLMTCAEFARLVNDLVCITQRVEYESMVEGDESPLPARLNNAIAMLGEILIEMTREEIDEEIKPGAVAGHDYVLMMSDAAKDLTKRATDLVKIGARNSRSDLEKIQTMHDHAVALGAACSAAEKSEGGNMAKAEITQQMANLSGLNESLTKSLDESLAKIAALTADVEMLKAQPAPSKVILRAVSKGQDTGGMSEQAAPEIAPVLKNDGSVDEVATALKKVHQSGGQSIRLR